MAKLPDKILVRPDFIATMIKNSYEEELADAELSPNDTSQQHWNASIAKIFADNYLRIAQEGVKE